jgi:hypothetical protein
MSTSLIATSKNRARPIKVRLNLVTGGKEESSMKKIVFRKVWPLFG